MAYFRIGHKFLCLACICATAGLLGCNGGGKATGTVSGKITINGQSPKMKGLQITFLAPNGRIFGAPIDEEGNFPATEVPVGEAKIGFLFIPPGDESSRKLKKNRFPGKGDDEAPAPTREEVPNPIPVHLRDGTTSKLSIEVKAGENQDFNHDVK